MVRILEDIDSGYDYGDYEILYSQRDGLFHIISDGTEIGNGFSTDRDAEEFINNVDIEDLRTNTELDLSIEEDNDLPVKRTTLRNLGKKYKDCKGIAYILSSEYKNKYATKNGIGSINDPDLAIFKSAELARQSRLRRNSDFGIEEVKLVNGSIKF